ncbi:MAG: geranyl transferase, partial [Candidatus Dadabacteria bacterium]
AKATYPALLGLSESRRRMEEITAEALALLDPYGDRADTLRALARFVVERRH